jgi:hypothetical protein
LIQLSSEWGGKKRESPPSILRQADRLGVEREDKPNRPGSLIEFRRTASPITVAPNVGQQVWLVRKVRFTHEIDPQPVIVLLFEPGQDIVRGENLSPRPHFIPEYRNPLDQDSIVCRLKVGLHALPAWRVLPVILAPHPRNRLVFPEAGARQEYLADRSPGLGPTEHNGPDCQGLNMRVHGGEFDGRDLAEEGIGLPCQVVSVLQKARY